MKLLERRVLAKESNKRFFLEGEIPPSGYAQMTNNIECGKNWS